MINFRFSVDAHLSQNSLAELRDVSAGMKEKSSNAYASAELGFAFGTGPAVRSLLAKPGRGSACYVAAVATVLISPGHYAAAAQLAPVEAIAQFSRGGTPNDANNMTANSADGMSGTHNMSGGEHAVVPAGVFGANMVQGGSMMLSYTPMIMGMENNYIGSSKVSQQYIATQIPFIPVAPPMMRPPTLRIVPASMTTEMNMFHLMFGLTDTVNVMIMSNYMAKSMTMTTFKGMKGATELGESSGATQGWGVLPSLDWSGSTRTTLTTCI